MAPKNVVLKKVPDAPDCGIDIDAENNRERSVHEQRAHDDQYGRPVHGATGLLSACATSGVRPGELP